MAETADNALQQARSRWGNEAARAAGAADCIGRAQPWGVLEPHDAPAAAAMLKWADDEGLAVVPRGGGTALTCGTAPRRLDVILSTARLTDGLDHCAGDLTAVVPAGMTLGALNAALAREGQWLPLDPPDSARATIGGILATNASGPRRHSAGAPRDLVIGVQMALVDGRLAKAGGRVVKNVAGYDLGRLLCGSLGSLAVVTQVIFKLSPLPPASRTVVAACKDLRAAAELGLTLAGTPLTPTAIEIAGPPARLLVRFETTEAAAERQARAVCEFCHAQGITGEILTHATEQDVWQRHDDDIWTGTDLVVRISVLPTDTTGAVDVLDRLAHAHGIAYRLSGRAALGVLVAGLTGTGPALSAAITGLRAWASGVGRAGSVVVLATKAVQMNGTDATVDPWGVVGDALPLMQAVKARFDPRDTLSPGRFPWGL